jgi:hypothetical protein
VLVALLGAFALPGCGDSSSSPPASAAGAGPRIGAPLRLADCSDWQRADVAERLGTIGDLEAFAGASTDIRGSRGPVLDEDDAYRLMRNYCSQGFARGFKLYKLYTRAASFVGH